MLDILLQITVIVIISSYICEEQAVQTLRNQKNLMNLKSHLMRNQSLMNFLIRLISLISLILLEQGQALLWVDYVPMFLASIFFTKPSLVYSHLNRYSGLLL